MAANEKPGTWEEWKAKHPLWHPLWLGIFGWPEWQLERLVYWCHGVAFFEVLEFAGRASVLVALILWSMEWEDRAKQSHYRAWELINSARSSTGDGGRRDALQDLNEDRVNLSAAPLADAYLYEVQLPNARLPKADLAGADLTGANLSGADLTGAKLSGADLSKADLDGAKLTNADLTGAKLINADLTGANLSTANLRGTNLHGANLTGADLTGADLIRANLPGVKLTGAVLTGAKLSEASIENARFCKTVMPDMRVNNRDCYLGKPR
jgi:uncharacterized protein YjbI with pentapeptide repeats